MRTESLVFRRVISMVSMLGALAAPASGQSVIDPTQAEFTASVDHHATASDGTPVVSGYDLEYYLVGASAPFQTQPLNKPTPGSDGVIRVPLSASGAMPTGMVYEARVRAIGPGGTNASAPSNSFMFSVACSYTVTPAAHTFGATGGTGTSAVTTGAGCTWGATSTVAWIVLATPVSTGGTGSVDFTVSANPTTATRTGTLTIGGQTVTVTQAGTTPCSYAVAANPTSFQASGGSGSATVTAGSGCGWTAASGASWITLSAGASGTGPGSFGYAVASYTGTGSRTGTITVGSATLAVTQSAAGSCTATVTPAALALGGSSTAASISVSIPGGCGWTAQSGLSWAAITSGASGTGAGVVTLSVSKNPGNQTRSGTIAVAGQTIAVTQSGSANGGGPKKPNGFRVIGS